MVKCILYIYEYNNKNINMSPIINKINFINLITFLKTNENIELLLK